MSGMICRALSIAALVAITASSCGDDATRLAGYPGIQRPVEPWAIPDPNATGSLIGDREDRGPIGRWYMVDVEERSDTVYYAQREMLYISTQKGEVLRYDMKERSLAGSWMLGSVLLVGSADHSLIAYATRVGMDEGFARRAES